MQKQFDFSNPTATETTPRLTSTATLGLSFEQPITAAQAPLCIKLQMSAKFVEAVWQRPVNDEEYRQGIRFLGLCLAILRAEYLLVDFTQMGNPTPQNQQSTSDYLQRALEVSTLKKCVWVLATEQPIYEAVVQQIPDQPNTFKPFYNTAAAREWLLDKVTLTGESILIPAHCSLKELKRFANSELGKATIDSGQTDTDKPATTRCKTDFMEILVDRSKSIIKLCWLRRVTSREYRYGILKCGRALLENNLQRLMVQNQRLGTLTLEDQTWLVNISAQIFAKSKMKLFTVVMSSDIMQQMASESIKARLSKKNLPYKSQCFLSEAEAMNWLQTTAIER